MPYNISQGLRSRSRVATLIPADAGLFPYEVGEASSLHHSCVAKTSKGIFASPGNQQISHLRALAPSAARKWLRLTSDGYKSVSGSMGGGSTNRRLGKLEHDVRGQTCGGLPARLKLHARHSVLRKVSTALRVRINPSMDELGPYVVIDDVSSAEVLIIAQILED
jgi:hypothetical protein